MMMVGQGYFDIALSVPLIIEYESVLKRTGQSPQLTDQMIDDILDYYCSVAIRLSHIHYLWRPFLRDSRDDQVLEAAVAAKAGAIITYNRSDFAGTEQFGIAVFTPREYLIRLEALQ
jgi:predicted nucleic acid-binding protein